MFPAWRGFTELLRFSFEQTKDAAKYSSRHTLQHLSLKVPLYVRLVPPQVLGFDLGL